MKKLVLLLVLCFCACKENSQQNKEVHKPAALSVVQKHTLSVVVDKQVRKEVDNWSAYTDLEQKFKEFSTISANEALNNALELSELVRKLKSNTKPKPLETLSFKTRINVLENETLRLKDMTYISVALTAKEVNDQVDKVMDAFAATNSKINAVFIKLSIDKELEPSN